ncbi:MAG: hypothetical protein ACYC39_09625 [Thiobacillus sp.]|nr:MAG: hypothetical protein B7Y27_15010 [Hydrogenophilales bacterium 16-64-40]OZA31831.1 MAG: hypothetical protein B7X82_15215 [Hydrogenophilales bacterium 17-64-65]HQT32919.1 hypothetical protein [Thiobacillus sp.]
MKKSRYFSDLIKNYIEEVDDLVTDSEGKSVLQKRLNEKRREIDAILPMIEFSPEMVSVIFYGAFDFKSPETMQRVVLSEPGDAGFLAWAELESELTVSNWATPLIESSLKVQGGDAFMVATAALEFLRNKDSMPAPLPEPEAEKDGGAEGEEGDGDGSDDLNEAGADWLAEQGFDPLDR